MTKYAPIINSLIETFSRLPGLGRKTAERFVFELLNWSENDLSALAQNLQSLKNKVLLCGRCFNLSETDPCPICRATDRQKNLICVVARPQDIAAMEKTGEYKGTYHVLGGTIETLDPESVNRLRFKELIARLATLLPSDNLSAPAPAPAASAPVSPLSAAIPSLEIILALDPDMAGETTSLYLLSLLRPYQSHIKITRLARGLPLGANVEYADQITLINALKDRREV